MFIYLLFSLSMVSGCYAMVNKDELRIEKITDPAKLEFGVKAALARVKKECETNESFPAALKEAVVLYQKNRFEQLKSRTNPYDIFIYQNGNPVGFLASHLDNDPSRIILDNFFASTSEGLSYLYTIAVTHLQTIYPQATKVWFAFIKYKASEHFAKKMDLEKSDYMDTFHDAQAFQGWEKSFK